MNRVGIGYDIHRLVENRKLILGGVLIPFERGLLGHSDADVLIHSIMDALLGAAGLPDIGQLFPNNDIAYKDVSSIELLKDVVSRLGKHRIINIDSTVICEQPPLAPHIERMRNNIAAALGADVSYVNVKATTNERLGDVGRGEAIAAIAVVLVEA